LQKLSLMSLQRRRERYIVLHMWSYFMVMSATISVLSLSVDHERASKPKFPPLEEIQRREIRACTTTHLQSWDRDYGTAFLLVSILFKLSSNSRKSSRLS
jgi:hypothetical protein